LAGNRLFSALKGSLGASEWIRRGLGALVLVAVIAIAFGLDTGFLTRISAPTTVSLEQRLLDGFRPPQTVTGGPSMKTTPSSSVLPVEGSFPSLAGATSWINSPPLTPEGLKGKVVLIDFWTYSCINCLRTLPYIRAWAEKYKDRGLVIIGVHTPEFAFEKDVSNVQGAVKNLGVRYPVALDNNYAIWNAFNNQAWPAHYLIDAKGDIREHHFGEGRYAETERRIQELLKEVGNATVPSGLVNPIGEGVSATADYDDIDSPETYIGYERSFGLATAGGVVRDVAHDYETPPKALAHNAWGFVGSWTVGPEKAVLEKGGGGLVYRFRSRDLHLVLGPGAANKPVRFRATIDGAAPGQNHGTDVDAAGVGVVSEQRLYQLVRQSGPISDHIFAIEFLDPGVEAYAFTFG
jgi:thiol-disulfide isomerase/thioredoxin